MKRSRQVDDDLQEESMDKHDTLQKQAFPSKAQMEVEGIAVDDVSDVWKYLQSVRKESDTVIRSFYENKSTADSAVDASRDDSGIENDIETPVGQLDFWEQQFLDDFMALKAQIAHGVESSQISSQWQQPPNIPSWRKYVMETPPPPFEVIYNFDHPTAMKLMVYFTTWLSGTINSNFSQWIYSLFLRVDNLVDHNDCHIIRGFGKKALKLLGGQIASETAIYTCKFIVLVVNRYYKQRDIGKI